MVRGVPQTPATTTPTLVPLLLSSTSASSVGWMGKISEGTLLPGGARMEALVWRRVV